MLIIHKFLEEKVPDFRVATHKSIFYSSSGWIRISFAKGGILNITKIEINAYNSGTSKRDKFVKTIDNQDYAEHGLDIHCYSVYNTETDILEITIDITSNQLELVSWSTSC